MAQTTLSAETIKQIELILKRGYQAEIKVEHGKLVVIEVKRKMIYKQA